MNSHSLSILVRLPIFGLIFLLHLSISSDINIKRYTDIADKAVENYLHDVKSDSKTLSGCDWKLIKSSRKFDLKIYSADDTKSPLKRYKAVGILPYSVSQVAPYFTDIKKRMSWDTSLLSSEELMSDKEKKYLLYKTATRSVGPVSTREFINIMTMKKYADGSFMCFGKSINDEKLFPVKKGHIRGESNAVGFLLTPCSSGTKLAYYAQLDLKGWLTPFVIKRAFKMSLAKVFDDLSPKMAKDLKM